MIALVPDLKQDLTPSHDLHLRLARMRQLLMDLDAAIADVERHRKELERIKRDVAALTKSIIKTPR